MSRVVAVTRLTDKFQATVPVRVRKLLDLKRGDYIVWTLEGDSVIVTKGG
jgi:AbrB family looped-hinge helix DNA binding protein